MSDLELYMNFSNYTGDPENQEISRSMPGPRWRYLQNYSTLRLIEIYGIKPPKIIEFIANIQELDYLAILVTAQFIADEILVFNKNSNVIKHIRNSKKGGPLVSKQDQAELMKILNKNYFFKSFNTLEERCTKILQEFNPDPHAPLFIHPDDALTFRISMDSNIVLEVKRARSLQGGNNQTRDFIFRGTRSAM